MDGVTAEVRKAIGGVQWFSFTTDIWSTDVSNDSLLSLTAHWITDSFERKSLSTDAASVFLIINAENNSPLVLPTLLDPRFKDNFSVDHKSELLLKSFWIRR